MTDIHWFSQCPKCGAERFDLTGMPQLGGYEGDVVVCSKCKSKFRILTTLCSFENVNERNKKIK